MTNLRLKKMSVYGFRVSFDVVKGCFNGFKAVIDTNAKSRDVRAFRKCLVTQKHVAC